MFANFRFYHHHTTSWCSKDAARVAEALGFHLLDSGALYRLVALAALRSGTPLDRAPALARIAPIVEWRWKVSGMVEGSDNRIGAKEDSPARLMFAFDGDKSSLPLLERSIFYITEKLSGRELPYALLHARLAGVGKRIREGEER